MRVFGFLMTQLLAIFYTACKTAFYFNEGNGALKRAGISDHRFDQGNQWWEKLIFVIIVAFSVAFALSNKITISKEMKRIMSPNSDEPEKNDTVNSKKTYKTKITELANTTGKILSIPSALWKTTVTTQSSLRLFYKLLYRATKSKGVSLGFGGFLAALSFISALSCNYVFFKEKKPKRNRLSISNNERTPLLENRYKRFPGCYAFLAHGLSFILAIITYALYFNSADSFLPHLSEDYKPLTSFNGTGTDIGFAVLALSDFAIAASTQRSYSRRLREDWIPEQLCDLPNSWCMGDFLDFFGSIAKASTSSMSLMALIYSFLPFWGSLSITLLAFPGNLLGEAATFLRKPPSAFLKAGRFFGIHDNKLSGATISTVSDVDEDSAIEQDYEYDETYQSLA